MKIVIQKQHLHVENIDVIAISSCSNLQIGDNDQVVLYSRVEAPPDGIQIGSFQMPTMPTSSLGKIIQLPTPSITNGKFRYDA